MREAVSKAILFMTVLALAVSVPAGGLVYAADETALTDKQKTQMAGSLLTGVMDLIIEQYAGDAVTPEDLYEAALRGMSGILDDYSEYLDEDALAELTGSLSGKLTGIGVVLRKNTDDKPEILRVLAGSPALEAGLKKADILLAVNDVSTEGLTIDEIVSLITNLSISEVTVQVLRGRRQLTYPIQKRALSALTVYEARFEELLGASVRSKAAKYRYVNISSVSDGTADELRAVIAQLKQAGVTGIALDLRGNTGGYLDVAVAICEQLVPEGAILHTVDSKGNKEMIPSALTAQPFEKIAVLVDGDTASAAELIAAALQDAQAAVVVGETTFGKGVIQTLFPLSTGGGFKLTTQEYFRRSGERINHVGVTPDIAADMRAADYETARDDALGKALAWLCQ